MLKKFDSLETQKNEIVQTIRSINKQILKRFIQLKFQFTNSSISNNEISNHFKTWKPIIQAIINQNLKSIASVNQNGDVGQKQLLCQFTKLYNKDQQYLEAIKCLNSTVEMIKEFIRMKAIKDPTTAVYQTEVITLSASKTDNK